MKSLFSRFSCLALLACCNLLSLTTEAASDELHAVRMILVSRCLECHSGAEPAGDLDLSRPDLAVHQGAGELSLFTTPFWEKISSGEMPPDQALNDREKAVLRAWLEAGANWNAEAIDLWQFSTAHRAGRDWWSLQPLAAAMLPTSNVLDDEPNPIDRFIGVELKRNGLDWNREASSRDLIRRLYFDLIGLPPPFEVVQEYEDAPSEEAYLAIVDRLLASPEYGERWARHWLDLVRFGESDGFERNAPREQFWPYRDWVIGAFNRDLSYVDFVRCQLAADSYLSNPQEIAAAQGYLVAGVHNTVVGSSRTMQLLARQDELEDLIGNIGQTFLGLTLNCARCHEHKYDPVAQSEYYQLAAALNGVSHGIVQVRNEAAQVKLDQLDGEIRAAKSRLKQLEQAIHHPAKLGNTVESHFPKPVFEFDGETGADSTLRLRGASRIERDALILNGEADYAESPPLPRGLREKTLEVCLRLSNLDQRGGAAIILETLEGASFDAIVFAELESAKWMAGSDFFQRTRSFNGVAENAADHEPLHLAITYQADGTIRCYRNGEPYGAAYQTSAPPEFPAGQARVLLGLRHSPPAPGKFLAAEIFGARLFDCVLSESEIAEAAAQFGIRVTEAMIEAELSTEQVREWRTLRETVRTGEDLLRSLGESSRQAIYSHVSLSPEPVNFLPRGDVTKPGLVVPPGTTKALSGCIDSELSLSESSSDRERRRALADWITAADNPLFHRVIVNRLWQHHFGSGFVRTTSDLGFNGGLPSHPELLDWFCHYLKSKDYSLKSLHRLMVTSRAWRQAATVQPKALKVDADNKWIWRKSPSRLDAEVVRDTMLFVAGKLNAAGGGPGYRDVTISDSGNGTTYYSEFDVESPEMNRRTIYRFSPRGGRPALLDSLDCPDPSSAAPTRTVTTTPLQALSLLNSPFVLRMCQAFASRAEAVSPHLPDQVDWMFRAAYARRVQEAECAAACALAQRHGLMAVARAIFNSNEFIIVY